MSEAINNESVICISEYVYNRISIVGVGNQGSMRFAKNFMVISGSSQ